MQLISILTTNRNAAIIIDSDKRGNSTPVNNTKKRIVDEFEQFGMSHWITKGKEIENYISAAAIQEMTGNKNIAQKTVVQFDINMPSHEEYDREIGQSEVFSKEFYYTDILGNKYKDNVKFEFNRLQYWEGNEQKIEETIKVISVKRSCAEFFCDNDK